MPEEREQRGDQQPGSHGPPLREHDQPAEERPDEVEGEADGEARRLGPLPEPLERCEREQEPQEVDHLRVAVGIHVGPHASPLRRLIDSIACSIRFTAPTLPECTLIAAGGRPAATSRSSQRRTS